MCLKIFILTDDTVAANIAFGVEPKNIDLKDSCRKSLKNCKLT